MKPIAFKYSLTDIKKTSQNSQIVVYISAEGFEEIVCTQQL